MTLITFLVGLFAPIFATPAGAMTAVLIIATTIDYALWLLGYPA